MQEALGDNCYRLIVKGISVISSLGFPSDISHVLYI